MMDHLRSLTSEEVVALWKERGSRLDDDIISEWSALHELDALEKQFVQGDRRALLAAMRKCANWDLVMPAWVSKAFISAYDSVNNMRKGSWDEAFGRPYPKGYQLQKGRRRRILGLGVWLAVRAILDKEPNTPIDEGLFERVGAEFGIGKTLANELYYRCKARLPQTF